MWGLKKQEDNKNSNYRKIGLETNMMSNNGRYQCVHCKRYFPKKSIEIDHIIPQSKGGGNQPQNLQCLCKKCNCSKGNDMTLTKSDLKKRKSSYAQYKRSEVLKPILDRKKKEIREKYLPQLDDKEILEALDDPRFQEGKADLRREARRRKLI